MRKELSVAAIQNGTVIDHIPAGQGMRIAKLLKLARHGKCVTLGLNLPSQSLGMKDLIKVEGREISEDEARKIAVFAPQASVSIIRGFERAKKFKPEFPKTISKLIPCPNLRCITNHERITTRFTLQKYGEKVELTCAFCEKSFDHDK